MEQDSITFVVEGIEAAPQGSKVPKGRRLNGSIILAESSKRVKPYREAVREAALATGLPIHDGPVRLVATFRFLRPKGHFGKKGLRPSAPVHITSQQRGDLDKLCRALMDGLTGSLLTDDSLVVGLTAAKEYASPGERPSTLVTITPLT